MLELKELENGNLKIIITDKEELLDVIDRKQEERDALFDMLERTGLIGNGWDVIFNPGMSEAPAIALNAEFDDDCNFIDCDKLWYFNEYQIMDYLKLLKNEGSVIFRAHENNKINLVVT